jgi:hypothetical protein
MDNPAEVRMLAVGRGGSPATFEISRWHKVGDDWFRAVLLHRGVAKDSRIGREVDLASPSADVIVYDSSGQRLLDGARARLAGQKVNLTAGNFDGVNGRLAKVGGVEFDFFATLYVN